MRAIRYNIPLDKLVNFSLIVNKILQMKLNI